MNCLLDTHVFIWADSNPQKLSAKVAALLQDRSNRLYLSVASIWEIQIKHQSGKLDLSMPLIDIITRQQQDNDIQLLPVNLVHVLTLDSLPDHHKDPFDRILIAQAQAEGLTLLSHDPQIAKYSVSIIW